MRQLSARAPIRPQEDSARRPPPPINRPVLLIVLCSTLIGAACGANAEEPEPAETLAPRSLDCEGGSMSVTIVEPPSGFSGHPTAREAASALAASLSVSGDLKQVDDEGWVIESEAGTAVAIVSVQRWSEGGWFAGEITTCEESG